MQVNITTVWRAGGGLEFGGPAIPLIWKREKDGGKGIGIRLRRGRVIRIGLSCGLDPGSLPTTGAATRIRALCLMSETDRRSVKTRHWPCEDYEVFDKETRFHIRY